MTLEAEKCSDSYLLRAVRFFAIFFNAVCALELVKIKIRDYIPRSVVKMQHQELFIINSSRRGIASEQYSHFGAWLIRYLCCEVAKRSRRKIFEESLDGWSG